MWADDGGLWIYRRVFDGSVFDVYDDSGRYLGQVPTTLAAGATGTHPYITGQRIVGVTTDSLGVAYVEVHRIVKN